MIGPDDQEDDPHRGVHESVRVEEPDSAGDVRPPGSEEALRQHLRGAARLRRGPQRWSSSSAAPESTGRAVRRQSTAVVPAQLPAALPPFAGRAAELAELDGLLPDGGPYPPAMVISVLAGTAGVGKTALAVHWATGWPATFRTASCTSTCAATTATAPR
jgi:hypothetical protein